MGAFLFKQMTWDDITSHHLTSHHITSYYVYCYYRYMHNIIIYIYYTLFTLVHKGTVIYIYTVYIYIYSMLVSAQSHQIRHTHTHTHHHHRHRIVLPVALAIIISIGFEFWAGWAYATQRSATIIARYLGGSAWQLDAGFPSRVHPNPSMKCHFTNSNCMLYPFASFWIIVEYTGKWM